MANINYHQAVTLQEQAKIFHSDLQCYVNYMHKFILEDTAKYEPLMFIFKYGMPGQFPEGRWGFTFNGDVGVMQRPIVLKGDVRFSPRYGEMERYKIELGSLFRVIAPLTDYYEYNSQSLAHPWEITQMHLAALANAIPLYQRYMLYKIFAGTEYKARNTYLKSWFEKYIEPSDGNTNGYIFCLSEGRGEINASKVIKPNKVKTNELKNRLEAIAQAIRNDSRKLEVDPAQDPLLKTKWAKDNLTPENQKTYALYNKVVELTNDIIRDGKFPDKKYMHKDFKAIWYKWETNDPTKHKEMVVKFTNAKGEEVDWNDWETPVTSAKDLVVLFPDKAWKLLKWNYEMSNPVTKYLDAGHVAGTFIPHLLIDKDEAIIMPRELLQFWIIPTSVKYGVVPYGQVVENTTDHIHAFDHSLDLLPFHSTIWLKLKAA